MQCVKKSDFRTGWRFCKGEIDMAAALEFDDSEWEEVIVPHTWNADDMFPGKSPEEAYIGPAWYRKRFTAAKLENGGRLFLLFEAIANVSEVYVNGCFLGGSEGGFLSFRLDITNALGDREEHIVAVRVDNSFYKGKMPPQTHDWEKYGGMYRPVWLLEKGGAFFVHKSIRIETPEVNESRGRVTARVRVCEQGTRTRPLIIRHIIKDPARKEIAHLEDTITTRRGATVESNVEFDPIQSPRLWSPETPNVYQIETVLLNGDVELDRESNPLGFRWFEFDADKGFSLNGKSMKLQGVNMHQEYPGLGWACPERYHRREAEMVKSAGMNFMRTSHYPRNERFLDACDELGIMVMEEQPFWHGSLRVSHGEDLIRAARRFSRDMVEQHGNHPSIIMWNTVNEVMLCVRIKSHIPILTNERRQ